MSKETATIQADAMEQAITILKELQCVNLAVLKKLETLLLIGPRVMEIATRCDAVMPTVKALVEKGSDALDIASQLEDCEDAVRIMDRLMENGEEALEIANELENFSD